MVTRVSKRPLRRELEERMFQIFWQCFADLKSGSEVFEFMDDLLSPAEKIMLAKRLAIAVLIAKGWNYQQISSALKVSSTTVNTIKAQLVFRGKGYKNVVNKIITNEEMSKFLEDILEAIPGAVSPIGRIGIASALRKTAGIYKHQQSQKRTIL